MMMDQMHPYSNEVAAPVLFKRRSTKRHMPDHIVLTYIIETHFLSIWFYGVLKRNRMPSHLL